MSRQSSVDNLTNLNDEIVRLGGGGENEESMTEVAMNSERNSQKSGHLLIHHKIKEFEK
jgi:hypothetical protein